MGTITLEAVEAKQAELAQMIDALRVQSSGRTIQVAGITVNLVAGEHYAGAILNEDGSVAHHLVLLAGEKDDINWGDAKAWAASIGGELPSRREQSLLYANCKAQFQSSYYWSNEQHAGYADCAWFQGFGNGYQNDDRKGIKLRARAVRRLVL